MANIARLGVALGLNSAEFVTGIDAASRKLDQFAVVALSAAKNAALALGAALSVAAYKAVAYADEIADVAAANDIAIDSIIKLTNALENSGGKGANAGKMIASFTDFVDKAAQGSFENQKIFNNLGISLKDIGNMSTQDLLLKTTDAIAGIGDSLTRSARAADAFGKSSKGVDMVDFAKGLREGKGATLEQEQAIKDAAQAFDLFKGVGRDIAMLITETLGPALLRLGKYLKDLDISNLSFTIFGKFIGFGTGNDPEIKINAISAEIEKLQAVKAIAMANGRTENIAIDRMIESLKKEQAVLLEIIESRQIANEKSKDAQKINEPKRLTTLGVDPKAKAAADKAAAEAKTYADMLRQKEFEADNLRLENKFSTTNAFLNEQQKIEQEYNKKSAMAATERDQKNITEQYKFKELNSHIYMLKEQQFYAEAEEKRKQLKFKNMAEEAKHEMALQEETAQAKAQASDFYVQGNVALRQKQELEYIALNRAQQMFVLEQESRYLKTEDYELAKEMLEIQFKHEDAIKAIKDDTRLIGNDRELALLNEIKYQEKLIEYAKQKNQILKDQKEGGFMEGFEDKMNRFGKNLETSFEAGGKAFDSLLSNMSSGLEEFVRKGELDFNKFAGSIIKDMLAIQLRASATNLFSMLAKSAVSLITGGSPTYSSMPAGVRADGGPVESNSPYIVGERGPELFVPRSAGAIVPNHSMAMMGGSTNVTNYNIQAIDTKSFEDRILGSSKAVWAANAYGAKNLSLGRGRT